MGNKLGKLKQYFNGDELASNVWLTKYALKDKESWACCRGCGTRPTNTQKKNV